MAELLQRIRSRLPEGWTALYDREYSWLEIKRTKSVLHLPSTPNQTLAATPEEGIFTIAFRVVPFVAPGEHHRLKEENDRSRKEANALYEELSKKIRTSKGSFEPATDAEKKEVERYEEIKKSIRTLPDYYFRNISLRWAFPGWSCHPYNGVEDQATRAECKRAQKKLLKLLSTYDASIAPQPLECLAIRELRNFLKKLRLKPDIIHDTTEAVVNIRPYVEHE